MKVDTKTTGFQPVEIKILLESGEEFAAFRELAGMDFTVSNTVFEFDANAKETLREILGTLYSAIQKY